MALSEHSVYVGRTRHFRYTPFANEFTYPLFSVMLHLNTLDYWENKPRLLSVNRRNVYAYYDRDHGYCDGTPALQWAQQQCHEKLHVKTSNVYLLTFPRVFGYVFNPLSVYYCYDDSGLAAVIFEVCNAYKQRHSYVVPYGGAFHTMRKQFYVSPYLPPDSDYHCITAAPSNSVRILIEQRHKQKTVFRAWQVGLQRSLTDTTLLKCLLTYPFYTLMVTRRIWWQALKLWVKGLRFSKPPKAARIASSLETKGTGTRR